MNESSTVEFGDTNNEPIFQQIRRPHHSSIYEVKFILKPNIVFSSRGNENYMHDLMGVKYIYTYGGVFLQA